MEMYVFGRNNYCMNNPCS